MRAIIILGLTSCNAWVRPAPSPERTRVPTEQRDLAVKVEMRCNTFDDTSVVRVGTGVIVSEWQVLTAMHVVDCQTDIARISVTTRAGKRYSFSPEKEWPKSDISRIQMASADSFRLDVSPPTLRLTPIPKFEPLYIQAAWPERVEVFGEATGHEYYGGNSYGGSRLTYTARTQEGNSGSGIYDLDGHLVGLHSGVMKDGYKAGSRVTHDMIPHQ